MMIMIMIIRRTPRAPISLKDDNDNTDSDNNNNNNNNSDSDSDEAVITDFFVTGSVGSFYDSAGNIDENGLMKILVNAGNRSLQGDSDSDSDIDNDSDNDSDDNDNDSDNDSDDNDNDNDNDDRCAWIGHVEEKYTSDCKPQRKGNNDSDSDNDNDTSRSSRV